MNQLTYKDCLDLKEAGFPQGIQHPPHGECRPVDVSSATAARGYHLVWDETKYRYSTCFTGAYINSHRDELLYVPTLSELIEACGDDFKEVGRFNDERTMWRAVSFSREGYAGETPEQAVKNLYIASQKKKSL